MREAKTTPSDEELVKAAKAGTTAAFEELTRRHFGLVYVIARARLDDSARAEDLAQEVFLRAWLHLERLRHPLHFSAWISRLARNMAIDWLRRDQRQSRLLQLVPLEPEAHARPDATAGGTREMMIADEERSAVQAALRGLPPAQRELVLLHFAEGLSQREIATCLGVNCSTVSRRISRALRAMRGTLEPMIRSTASEYRAPSDATGRAVGLIGAAAALSLSQRAALAAVGVPPAVWWLGWGAAKTPLAIGATAAVLLLGGWMALRNLPHSDGQIANPPAMTLSSAESNQSEDASPAVRSEPRPFFANENPGLVPTTDDENFRSSESLSGPPIDATRIWGRVITEHGEPIPEVVVALAQADPTQDWGWRTLRVTQTDFDGFYAIEGFPRAGRRRQIIAQSPHRAQIAQRIPDALISSLRIDLSLPSDRVITGRVIWADGRPVARARIAGNAYTSGESLRYSLTQADDNGEFRLEGLPQAAYFTRAAPEEGTFERAVEHQANEDHLIIRLPLRTGVIEGQAVGQFMGQPLPDQTLWLDESVPTVTDSEGRFRFESVSLDQHTIVWRIGEREHIWGAQLSGTVTHLTMTITEPEPMPISGTVVDAETGAPVSNLGLVLRSIDEIVTTTDGDGCFRCDDVIVLSYLDAEVASGEWIMEEREDEEDPYRRLRIEREEDLHDIRLAVRRGAPLAVQVVDAAGVPLSGALLWRWSPEPWSRVFLGITDALGHWQGARPANLGEFCVIGSHRDHALLLSPMLESSAAEARVEPFPTVDVSVHVMDSSGASLPAVGVTAIPLAPFARHGMNPPSRPEIISGYRLVPNDPQDHPLTDLDGRVTLTGLPRLRHHLWAETSTGGFASTEVDLTSGSSPIPVTIRLGDAEPDLRATDSW